MHGNMVCVNMWQQAWQHATNHDARQLVWQHVCRGGWPGGGAEVYGLSQCEYVPVCTFAEPLPSRAWPLPSQGSGPPPRLCPPMPPSASGVHSPFTSCSSPPCPSPSSSTSSAPASPGLPSASSKLRRWSEWTSPHASRRLMPRLHGRVRLRAFLLCVSHTHAACGHTYCHACQCSIRIALRAHVH